MRSTLLALALVLFGCKKEEVRTDIVLTASCIQCHVTATGMGRTITDFVPGTIRYDRSPVDTVIAVGRYNFNATAVTSFSLSVTGGDTVNLVEITENGNVVARSQGGDLSISYVSGE